MTRLRSLIKEVLSQPKKKDCNCGCNTCGDKAPILTEGKFKSLISEGLQYHIDKKISLFESVYRIGSDKHLELIREARALWIRGIIEVSDDDKGLLETHLGHFGLYEGVEVPLDLPMVDEGFYSSPSDLEDSGLNVIPKDQIHANKLQDALEDSGLYGEWNPREGYFFFPEEEDGYDYLEEKIQELMDDYNIQGYIEGVFEESLNENNLLRQTNLSSEEYQKAKKLKGFNADDYTFSSDNNLYVKKSSLDEAKYRVEYTTQDGEKAKSKVYNSEEEADKKEEDLVNSGIKQAKVVKVEESINEAKVDYDFSKEELIRVIKQLKSGASGEIGMIKAFEKALGRELTDDEIRGFKIDPSKVGRASLEERINTILEAKKKAKSKKKDPPLNKPKRGGSKAYYVYVRDPKTKKIKKVSFGSGGLRAKIKNKEARNAFAARHNCKNKKDRTKAGYWSCNLPRYAEQLGLGSKMNTFW